MPVIRGKRADLIGLGASTETDIRFVPTFGKLRSYHKRDTSNSWGSCALYVGVGGITYKDTGPRAIPLGRAFPSTEGEWSAARIAYLRKLAAHRRRIRKELAAGVEPKPGEQTEEEQARMRRRIGASRYKPVSNVHAIAPSTTLLPGRRRWDSLRMVDCRLCSKALLAESEEPTRRFAEAADMRCVRRMPPPVHCRKDGAPLCEACARKIMPRATS